MSQEQPKSLPSGVYEEIIYQDLIDSFTLEEIKEKLKKLSMVNKEFHKIIHTPSLLRKLFYGLIPEQYRIEHPKKTLLQNFEESLLHYNKRSMTSYEIHDNGGVPYKVDVAPLSGDFIRVYVIHQIDKDEDEDEDEAEYDEGDPLIMDCKQVWIGKSIKNEMTTFDNNYGPQFDGNTILVQLKKSGKYVWIGNNVIYSFVAFAPIKKFESPVGNNDVPYPWAIDENNSVYLFLAAKVIIKPPIDFDFNSPYDSYYGMNERNQVSREHIINMTNLEMIATRDYPPKFLVNYLN